MLPKKRENNQLLSGLQGPGQVLGAGPALLCEGGQPRATLEVMEPQISCAMRPMWPAMNAELRQDPKTVS